MQEIVSNGSGKIPVPVIKKSKKFSGKKFLVT
jgi:hypothetical protein